MKPLLSKYEKELAAAKKDNDLIYSDAIPSVSSLKSPEGAIIAKVIEFKGPLSEDFSGKWPDVEVFDILNIIEWAEVLSLTLQEVKR